MTNKKALTESDICDRYIPPAVAKAGWAANRWRREHGFTDGKIIVRGKLLAATKSITAERPTTISSAEGAWSADGRSP